MNEATPDNAARATPVAWRWLDTSNFRKNIPSAAIREHWNPVYSAATVAALEAEVERLQRALTLANAWNGDPQVSARTAVENANALTDIHRERADVAERRLSEVREIQRTHYGDGVGLHLAMIRWARDYDALTGARAK